MMSRLRSLLTLALAATALSSAALAQDRDASFDAAAASRAKSLAVRAAALGDWAEVTRLLEKVYRDDPSLGNEFNLATAYVHTDQASLAIPLYADVARKGQFNQAVALYQFKSDVDPLLPRRSFNYSDEALRRIAALQGDPLPSR